jgi:type I site-specific restriction-modification system R (restriction) subunit
MSDSYTEDHLVEQPAVQLMQHGLGGEVVTCYDEWSGGVSNQGRDGKREVVLVSRLRPALQRLNPDLPVEAIEGAVEEICRDRTALSLAEANREIDKLLKQGVKVSFPDQEHAGQRDGAGGRLGDFVNERLQGPTLYEEIDRFHQTVKSNNIVKSSLSDFTGWASYTAW